MRIICLFSFCLFFILCSFCVPTKDRDPSIYDNWKLDSLGCLGYRHQMKQYVCDTVIQKGMHIDTVKELLGKPYNEFDASDIQSDEEYFVLYMTEAVCENDTIIATKTKCEMWIIFDSALRVKDSMFLYACE